MEKYRCRICNYSSEKISNLERHNKSVRHIKNLHERDRGSFCADESDENPDFYPDCESGSVKSSDSSIIINRAHKMKNKSIFICEFCGTRFTLRHNYSRHIKYRCKKLDYDTDLDESSDGTKETNEPRKKSTNLKKISGQQKNNNDTAVIMKMILDMKNDIKIMSDKINDMQNGEKSDIIKIAKNTAETSNKSMNILKFAMKKLQNAPPIKKLEKQDVAGLITYVPDGKIDERNKHSIEEIIIHRYAKNRLVDFVGDAIVECYSTSNPKMQSVWGTDVARLAFIIKEKVGDSNKSEWVKDHNGTKILNLIIKPIYKKISDMMEDHTKKIYDTIKKKGIAHLECARLTEQSEKAFEIKATIFNNKIQKATLRYIAPQLGFTTSIINNIDDYDSPIEKGSYDLSDESYDSYN